MTIETVDQIERRVIDGVLRDTPIETSYRPPADGGSKLTVYAGATDGKLRYWVYENRRCRYVDEDFVNREHKLGRIFWVVG